jgi:hypothetical protein
MDLTNHRALAQMAAWPQSLNAGLRAARPAAASKPAAPASKKRKR